MYLSIFFCGDMPLLVSHESYYYIFEMYYFDRPPRKTMGMSLYPFSRLKERRTKPSHMHVSVSLSLSVKVKGVFGFR